MFFWTRVNSQLAYFQLGYFRLSRSVTSPIVFTKHQSPRTPKVLCLTGQWKHYWLCCASWDKLQKFAKNPDCSNLSEPIMFPRSLHCVNARLPKMNPILPQQYRHGYRNAQGQESEQAVSPAVTQFLIHWWTKQRKTKSTEAADQKGRARGTRRIQWERIDKVGRDTLENNSTATHQDDNCDAWNNPMNPELGGPAVPDQCWRHAKGADS